MPTKSISSCLQNLWSKVGRNKLISDSITTTLYTAFGKGAGFLIPFFIAAWFGVSPEMDAFFFAYAIIFFFATSFSIVIESIIVPFIAEADAKGEDVGLFVGRVLGISAVGIGALTVVLLLAIKPMMSVISNFSPEGLELIFIILLETSPLAILLVWTSVLSGSFNAYRNFSAPALSPAFRAFVTLAFIYLLKDAFGVHSIAWGYVAGEVSRLLILMLILKKQRLFELKLAFSWNEKFKDFLKVSSYQVAGMSLAVLSPLIDRIMASWLSPKSVSMLEYSEKLFFIPSNLFTMGFLTVLLSKWSNEHYNGGDLNKGLSRILKTLTPFLLVFTAACFLLGGPATKAIYGSGTISGEDLATIAVLFSFFVLGIPAIMVGHIFSRGLLVQKDTVSLFKVASFKVALNIILNLVFISYFGLPGIAISSTVTAILAMAAYYYYFRMLKKGVRLELQGKAV